MTTNEHTNVLFRPDSAKIIISGESDLTELSFAIETVLSNFIGRGIAAFEFNRSTLGNKSCVIDAKSLVGPQLMALSKVGNIGYAVQNGVYPRTLKMDFLADKERIAHEGQNRLTKYFASMRGEKYTESVVVSHDFDSRLPLSHITYGLSDMFTGLFAMGVTYLKWQGSMKESQLYLQHTFSDKQLKNYLFASQDYDLRRKVATL
jgi:hypothetical protein